MFLDGENIQLLCVWLVPGLQVLLRKQQSVNIYLIPIPQFNFGCRNRRLPLLSY